jgi:hypothetical protein
MTATSIQTRFGPGPLSRVVFLIAGALAFASTLQAMRSSDLSERLGVLFFSALLCSAIAFIAQKFSRAGQNQQQRLRDQRASEILTALKEGQPNRSFSLYLRGFTTTGKMPTVIEMDSMSRSGEEGFLDFEAVLAKTLEPIAPLVALGRPGEQIGAGRVPCDDDQWQENLVLLAGSAQYIFVLPTDSPGTMWEIDFLVRMKLFQKCFFLMPPRKSKTDKEEWRRTVARAQQSGIYLRAYKHKGMIFTIREDGTPERTRTFGEGLLRPKAKQIGTRIGEMLGSRGDEPDKRTWAGKSDYLDKDYLDEEDDLDDLDELVLRCPSCDALPPERISSERGGHLLFLLRQRTPEAPRGRFRD